MSGGRILYIAVVASVAVAGLSGACSSRRGEVIGEPVEVDTATEQEGRTVFMENCHRCHPWGEAGQGPALNNKPLPRGVIALQIRNGIGAMPGFSKNEISHKELDALVEYVVTLRTRK